MRSKHEPVTLDPGSAFRCLPRLVQRYDWNLHQHGVVELHLLTRGSGSAVIGDRVLPWRAPVAFLVGPNLVHTWTSDPRRIPPPHHSLVVQWPPELLLRLVGVPEAARAVAAQERAARGLVLTGAEAERLVGILGGFATDPGGVRLGRWLEALAAFAEAKPLASPRAPLRRASAERLATVCAWLEAHLLDTITLAGAGRAAGMHPQALARFFRRHTGLSLIAYVHALRVGRACHLLLEPERTIAECARSAGFHGMAHFNRVFRAVQGCTPQAWRRAATGG
jgi:AraC-like DNA-binding protein